MRQTGQSDSITGRIATQPNHPVWRSQYISFVDEISKLKLAPNSTALSVSCGHGMWDYLAFKNNPDIKTIIATDVVDCQVRRDDIDLLNSGHVWSFQKVFPDSVLPIGDNRCDLVFHQDVIEHTTKPFLLLRENYRILKSGGYLLLGTPNIFRPANIVKLLLGKLAFPWRLSQPDAGVHIQEFNEYQLRTMVEEVGFKIISIRHCFFGISFLNINFRDFPTSSTGKNLCQYLFVVAWKEPQVARPKGDVF